MMKDELFDAQLVRTMGHSVYGAADVGECLATAAAIKGTSLDGWYDAWSATAARVLATAETSLAAGDREGARSAFFRATNYFRTAGVLLMGTPVDPRLVASHAREVDAFRRGAELLTVPPQHLDVPYKDGTMPAHFYRPADDDMARPTLILTNGYDGTVEELYFWNGAAALARGYNVLAFDGPGQVPMIIDHGVAFRPDWENVVTPVVDTGPLGRQVWTLTGIALAGLSFGGYLAPRAATKEHRLAACVSDCGPYDLFVATTSRLPGVLARQLPDGNPRLLQLPRPARHKSDEQAHRRLGAAPKPDGARRGHPARVLSDGTGVLPSRPRARDHLSHARLRHPDVDDLTVNAHAFFEALTCPDKKYIEFKEADGAGRHCESGARTAFHQEMFAWLDEVLRTEADPAVLG